MRHAQAAPMCCFLGCISVYLSVCSRDLVRCTVCHPWSQVVDVDILNGRGFGFVTMATADDAQRVLANAHMCAHGVLRPATAPSTTRETSPSAKKKRKIEEENRAIEGVNEWAHKRFNLIIQTSESHASRLRTYIE